MSSSLWLVGEEMGSRNEALRTVILFQKTKISDTRIKIYPFAENKSHNLLNRRRSCGENLDTSPTKSYAVLFNFYCNFNWVFRIFLYLVTIYYCIIGLICLDHPPPGYSSRRMPYKDVHFIDLSFLRSKDSEKNFFSPLPPSLPFLSYFMI